MTLAKGDDYCVDDILFYDDVVPVVDEVYVPANPKIILGRQISVVPVATDPIDTVSVVPVVVETQIESPDFYDIDDIDDFDY